MRLSILATAVSITLIGLSVADDVHAAIRKQMNIPAQGLGPALRAFAKDRNLQIVYISEEVDDLQTRGVAGDVTADEALKRLLDGTDLGYRYVDERTVTVFPVSAVTDSDASSVRTLQDGDKNIPDHKPSWQRTRQAPSEQQPLGGGATESRRQTDAGQELVELEEVLVTGSHIRGGGPIGSQPIVIDRAEIEASGYGRIQDLLQTLPQNFTGSASEDISADNGVVNFGRGQSIDLRGLGAGSTLVLINGRRQPEGGLDGSFVDISSIATSAVERIEILPDGASALYGSDAIGGVVNFILRKDFTGLETNARVSTSDGDAEDYRVSLLGGRSWGAGNFLVGYQFQSREALPAAAAFYASKNGDYRALGGSDMRNPFGDPGNILDPNTFLPVFAVPKGQDGTSLTSGDLIPRQVNYRDDVTGVDASPEQRMHSAFFTLSEGIGDRLTLFLEGRYSKRDMALSFTAWPAFLSVPATNPFYVNPFGGGNTFVFRNFGEDLGGNSVQESATETYALTGGTAVQLSGAWELNIAGTYGRETNNWEWRNIMNIARTNAALNDPNPETALNPFSDGAGTNPATIDMTREIQTRFGKSTVASFSAIADGPVLELPAGNAKLALGLDYRDERLSSGGGSLAPATGAFTPSTRPVGSMDRQVSAAFAELRLPLIGRADEGLGLQLSIAGRYENYSDFGSTFNPKIGIDAGITSGFKLRGTWGTSFRAPRFNELSLTANPANSFGLFGVPDPASQNGVSNVLVLSGGNPDLQEETAETWTAGFALAPANFSGISFSATYFNIDYDDKVAVGGFGDQTLLSEAEWAEIITRNPTQTQIAAVCGSSTFTGDCPPSVAAILDLRTRNLAGLLVRGIDIDLGYRTSSEFGELRFGISGTNLFTYERTISPDSPSVDALNTTYNPISLRLRGRAGWSFADWQADAFLNYSDRYRNRATDHRVSSWTTVDLSIGYELKSGSNASGLHIRLSAINLLNKEPPFQDIFGGFDQANANDIGRSIALDLKKAW